MNDENFATYGKRDRVFIKNVDIMNERWIPLKENYLFFFSRQQKADKFPLFKVVTNSDIVVFGARKLKNNDYQVKEVNDLNTDVALRKDYNYYGGGNLAVQIKEIFRFMLIEYGFKYKHNTFKTAVNKNNKFWFYGPVEAYSFYNEEGCLTIFRLVQRDEWNLSVSRKYSNEQATLRDEIYDEDGFILLNRSLNEENRYSNRIDYLIKLSEMFKRQLGKTDAILGIKVSEKSIKNELSKTNFCRKYNQLEGSTCYHELQKGNSRKKYWLRDSLYIHDDILRETHLIELFYDVLKTKYAEFGDTLLNEDEWNKIKAKSLNKEDNLVNIVRELDSWLKPVLSYYGYAIIRGI